MTETELERMVVRIIGDASLYERMLLRAEMMTQRTATTLMRLGKQIEAFGASMMRAGRNLSLALTLPIGIWVKKSVEEFRKFDLAMTETFAKMGRVTPKLRKEMEELTKSMAMEGKTSFSPTELAQGYEALASAGLDAGRSMAALPAMARFAQAGAFDLNQAVKLIVGSMASFGQLSKDPLEFTKSLEHFSDVIVGVANETTTGVEQVARAMSADAAVAARQYGMSLEELGAILGVYALQNKDAEEAGNLTGRAIRLMTDTFIRKEAIWKSMGIDLVDKATGKWIKFADAIGMLEQAFKGMTPYQVTSTLRMLGFKTLTLKAILPLVGMSDELRRQTKMYEEVGVTAEMASIQIESFSNQMKTVWNNVKVVDIEIGEILAPLLLQLGETVKKLAAYWKTLSLETKQNILIAIGLVGASGPLLLVLGALVWSVGMAITGFGMLRTVIVVLSSVVGTAITWWVSFRNAMIASTTAAAVASGTMTRLKASLIAIGPELALVVGWLTYTIVRPFGDWLFGVTEFNKQLERTKELTEQIDSNMRHRQNLQNNAIMNIEDPEQRFQALKQAVADAKKNVEGYKASVKGAQAQVDALNTTWNYFTGNKILELENTELQSLKANAKAAQDNLQQLQLALQGMKPGGVPAGMPLGDANPLDTKLNEEADELISKLEEQFNTFGVAQGYVEAYKLALQGLDEGTYNHIVSLINQNQAMERQAELAKEIETINASVSEQVSMFGKSAAEIDAFKLSLAGATYQEIQFNQAAHEQLEGMKAYQSQIDKAKSLTEKYMSPQEKLMNSQAELDTLLMANMITLETYKAAMADLQNQTQKDYTVRLGVSGIDAVASDSAEALARIREFRTNMSMTAANGLYHGTMPGNPPGQGQQPPVPVQPVPPNKSGSGDTSDLAVYLRELVLLAKNEAKKPTVHLSASNLEKT